jgi:hypothetical protein
MSELYWNEKLDFLKAIRTGWCNDDYIEFLVEKVWKRIRRWWKRL